MNQTLIDFTQPIENYTLLSDATERAQGKSHGAFDFQSEINIKKHYFFTYLDPQPNGAAFVSVYIPLHLTLTSNQSLCLIAKGLQKQATIFQFLIKNATSEKKHFIYYKAFTIEDKKMTLRFPLSDFSASYRGQPVPTEPMIDTSNIQSIGIRIVGRNGASKDIFQKGLYGLSLYRLSIC